MTENHTWLDEDGRRLLESYLAIGCTTHEARIAVAGDLLQRATGPGADLDEAEVRRRLDLAGLDVDEVRDALGLRFDAAS
ncbi:hypothetical protein [Nocardioides marmotae]|uniref:Uncharacterized protein n=1 Tax=Nocardioides marmotae TaxID=2663857 RepID=A0A6I3JE46_9ACTN|nr:hypothetical protein [Nocardioides marmotae]MCR6032700.1 hypothetical protein [Gordonia jinghuaiqii]MBC9732457.1 hypothetical protein [Nocardioides marmotae]MTB83576.1 hypothetical protein [Nocardioides marmotae]MTB96349.1 hypothetical protein [Nocardioides marmotae]QKE03167.1 hypothetical protein HPC71_20465 [Nocardioides marmotae]